MNIPRGRYYFHGTSLENARAIVMRGFAASYEDNTLRGGVLGTGVYVTAEFRTALFFGDTLLQVELQEGTKILDLGVPVDAVQMDSLVREFGRGVLTSAPWKVIPRNKRLTQRELASLVRYHYKPAMSRRAKDGNWPQLPDYRALARLRSVLVRHGYHGFGHPENADGIVVFQSTRVKCREVVLRMPQGHNEFSVIESSSLDELRQLFEREGDADAKSLADECRKLRAGKE